MHLPRPSGIVTGLNNTGSQICSQLAAASKLKLVTAVAGLHASDDLASLFQLLFS